MSVILKYFVFWYGAEFTVIVISIEIISCEFFLTLIFVQNAIFISKHRRSQYILQILINICLSFKSLFLCLVLYVISCRSLLVKSNCGTKDATFDQTEFSYVNVYNTPLCCLSINVSFSLSIIQIATTSTYVYLCPE